MLEARGLVKRYGDLVAVNGISLRAGPGEMVGLLGPNGAGKTTTVSMVAGLLEPDEGEVLIEGRRLRGDTDPLKRRIGLVPQEPAIVEELSAVENLLFFAALYGLDGREARGAAAEVLELVGLSDRSRGKAGTFSGGMKRRLNLATALLHDPQILLLDEPTVGVDPQSRRAIFDNLETLKGRGMILIYTTHYMEEAERLCDRVVVIDHGQVVADDTLQGLYRLLPGSNVVKVELEDRGSSLPLEGVRAVSGVRTASLEDGVLSAAVTGLDEAPRLLQWLVDHGHPYRHVVTERPNLETVFLSLTGRSLRD